MYHQNFSFEAASWQRPSSHQYTTDSTVSPYDYSYPAAQHYQMPPSPPAVSVTELAEQLRTQSLHANAYAAQQRYYNLSTPPAEEYAATSSSEPSTRRPSYTCLHMRTSSIRQQRQANTRLQSSSAHLSQISSLVSRMVESGEQCAICSPSATSTVSSQSTLPSDDGGDYMEDGNNYDEYEEDEGFSEPGPPIRMDPTRNLTYRRSSDFGRTTEGCVAKSIKMRRGRRSVTAGGPSKR